MKKLILLFCLLLFKTGIAQDSKSEENVETVKITAVNAESLSKIAKESTKKYTLFYTFGIWCKPCRLHLPTAMKLAKDYDLDFYVIIVDSWDSDNTLEAVSYLKEQDKDINIAVLSDLHYGTKTRKRNKIFVKEITPPQFEEIADYSKYILLNNSGEVLIVTNYKDNEGHDWRDDSQMVKDKIVPLIK